MPAPAAPPPAPAPATRARRLLAPLGTLAGVVAAFTYVGLVDPNESGHYPVCPLLSMTGLYCPGCGGLRSAHAVAHGDIAAAFGSNALAVVGYAIFAAVWLGWLILVARGTRPRVSVPPFTGWAVGAVIVVFTVLRNLPFGSSLAP
ncbi:MULTISPECIES: DUF2752 domain-containing protein [unclassified Streptomyces]|uniref:DUF2752 domain-containing protein n=1 Tax=unclassified Streptomyces TaxID=2593676 RepID=UPI002E35FBD4|nr:DUF2752 domain-containing protein [Streptomyces sp. NBC_01716]